MEEIYKYLWTPFLIVYNIFCYLRLLQFYDKILREMQQNLHLIHMLGSFFCIRINNLGSVCTFLLCKLKSSFCYLGSLIFIGLRTRTRAVALF